MKEKTYSLEMRKSEVSSVQNYERINNIIVEVTSNPIVIAIPTSVVLPRAGCNMPIRIEVNNSPYSDIYITIQYDNLQFPETIFNVDLEFSDQIMHFSPGVTFHYISFCITKDFPISAQEVTINLALGGK